MKRTLKEVKSYIQLMKKEGVLSLKVEGLELQVAQASFIHEDTKEEVKEENKAIETYEPTDEEILFWSAPSLPNEAN